MQTLTREAVKPAGAHESVRVVRPLAPSGRTPERATPNIRGPKVGVRGPAPCDNSSPGSLHGSGLTARGRVLFALAWVVLIVVGALVVARPFDDSAYAQTPTVPVEVQPGDTLWEFARAADPQGDPREVVHTIVELNDLNSAADIHPGDTLLVPDFR